MPRSRKTKKRSELMVGVGNLRKLRRGRLVPLVKGAPDSNSTVAAEAIN